MRGIALLLALNWINYSSVTTSSLRGLSVVSPNVVWASGAHGTVIKTSDAGAHWSAIPVRDAETLDFRDIEAFDSTTAYTLSIGDGASSRVYKTTDGGKNWQLLFTNPDTKGFFDAIAFWDRTHGILVGDPVDGQFVIFTTDDAGRTWQRRQTPPALPEEGAFAASGTCLIVRGQNNAWFATGGPSGARVFRSYDRGRSWQVAGAPLGGSKTSGIFSLAFADSNFGVAVGGDYQQPNAASHMVAITHDGGKTWVPSPATLPFRSAVTFLDSKTLLAAGTSGADISHDSGATWERISDANLNAIAAIGSVVFAVGPKGALLRSRLK